MKFSLFLFSLLGVWKVALPIAEDHAIYISVIKISHKAESEEAMVLMRVFTDDLVNVLKNRFGVEKIKEKELLTANHKEYVFQYFKEHFLCNVNEELLNFSLQNIEKTGDVYQIGFKMNCPTIWKTAQIDADFFMELFPAQSNVFHIETADLKRFGRTIKGKEKLEVNF